MLQFNSYISGGHCKCQVENEFIITKTTIKMNKNYIHMYSAVINLTLGCPLIYDVVTNNYRNTIKTEDTRIKKCIENII